MGVGSSSLEGLEKELDEYVELTYLTKAEIVHLFGRYQKLIPSVPAELVLQQRLPFDEVSEEFTHLKYNPFRDRICYVFSSAGDDTFSFDDILDLYSVMCSACPDHVKAAWAFRIFDFDGDNGINENDLSMVIDRLTAGFSNDPEKMMNDDQKKEMATKILSEMDIESSGRIGQLAFQHGVGKMAEFASCFSFSV